MTTGKNHFTHLPIYGPKDLDSTFVNGKYKTDTIYHTITDFQLTDHLNRPVSLKDMEGKIFVADFFFASCKSICPVMTGSMQRIQDRFAAARELRLLSFTVNPERDSVPALAAYARQHLVNSRKWMLLTGDKKTIYDQARYSFLVTALPGDGGPDDFIHDDKLVLVDKEKHIRGYYVGTDSTEVNRLMDEITVLLLEYKEKEQQK
jgi:protein SCO1/2